MNVGHNRLFWAAAALTSVATAALPLLALAWSRAWLMHDDFGMELTPAVRWFAEWQLAAFLTVGVACMAAVAMLCLPSGRSKATYLAIAFATVAIVAEATIAMCCVILPIAFLVHDLS